MSIILTIKMITCLTSSILNSTMKKFQRFQEKTPKRKFNTAAEGGEPAKYTKVTMLQAFKTIIWPRRRLVFIGLLLIVLSRLASLVLPWKSKALLDDVIPNKDYDQLYSLLLIVGIAILVQAITSFLLTKILSVQAQFLISELRAKVQKKVLSLPISFFDNTKSGVLVSRIMTDVEGVRNLIGTGLVQMVGGSITAVISLILLIQISPSMTLFVLVPVAILSLIHI